MRPLIAHSVIACGNNGDFGNADVSSTNGSTQGTQSEQHETDGDKRQHMLPSVTTDTEPWSTAVETLHEKDSPSHSASHSTAKDTIGRPASLQELAQ